MSVRRVLENRAAEIHGMNLSLSERRRLEEELLGLVPPCILDLMTDFGLIGLNFYLPESDDKSELGAELKWLTAEQIIKEAIDFFPGRLVSKRGYLPIGSCLTGSGDPYFLVVKDLNSDCDPPLVRVPHDYATGDSYPEDKVELVSAKLSEFFRSAEIQTPLS